MTEPATPDVTPDANPDGTPAVTRTVELDAAPDDVLAALTDPELLSAWLGRWTPTDDGGATVLTDDGVVRTVADLEVAGSSVRWTWAPADDPRRRSSVSIGLVEIGGGTRLTLTECAPAGSAPAALASADPACSGVPWAPALAALRAVLLLAAPVLLLAAPVVV